MMWDPNVKERTSLLSHEEQWKMSSNASGIKQRSNHQTQDVCIR